MPKLPGYLNTESPQKQGKAHEKKVRQTIASGQVWFDKADIEVKDSNDNYRVDSKLVVLQKSYKLSLAEIEKFYEESSPQTPVYMIYLGDFCIKAIIERVKPKKQVYNG